MKKMAQKIIFIIYTVREDKIVSIFSIIYSSINSPPKFSISEVLISFFTKIGIIFFELTQKYKFFKSEFLKDH